MITTPAGASAVLLSADEFESLQETTFWLSQKGIRDDIAQSENDIRAGNTFAEDQIRAAYGVPKRHQH